MTATLTEGLLENVEYGRGFFETVKGVQPGAGANYLLPVDFRYITVPLYVAFELATSNHVSNRFVTVDYDDGNGNIYASSGIALAVAASSTVDFAGQHDRSVGEHVAGSKAFFPLSHDYVRPGYAIKITVTNIDGADQLSKIVWGLDRLPTGPRGYQLGAISHTQGRRGPVLSSRSR